LGGEKTGGKKESTNLGKKNGVEEKNLSSTRCNLGLADLAHVENKTLTEKELTCEGREAKKLDRKSKTLSQQQGDGKRDKRAKFQQMLSNR